MCLERDVPAWVRASAVALDAAICLKMTQKKRHEVATATGSGGAAYPIQPLHCT